MKGSNLVVKLVLAQAIAQPTRIVLTCAAIVASSAAVAWVVSGYDALVSQFDENAQEYLGRYDLLIVPSDIPLGSIAPLRPELIEALTQDPFVREVNPLAQSRVTVTALDKSGNQETAIDLLVGSRPPVNGAPPLDPILVATSASAPPHEITAGRWLSENPLAHEAVLSRGAATQLGINAGDEVLVTSIANRTRLKVIGIVDQPTDAPGEDVLPPHQKTSAASDKIHQTAPSTKDTPSPSNRIGIPIGVVNSLAIQAIYVRMPMAETINGYPAKIGLLQIKLKNETAIDNFSGAWSDRLLSESPALKMLDYNKVQRGMQNSDSVNQKLAQAYSATALACLAAVFIIFTTLSMGVGERRRELAILRAIALTRMQVASLVFFESVLLAVIGWIGGLVAGRLILWLAALSQPDLYADGGRLGWGCVMFSGMSVLIASLGAAIIPAWQATRTRPLDAIADVQKLGPLRWPYVCLVVGLLLMLLAPASVFLLSVGDASRTLLYAAVSYPCLLIGTMLIVPATILTCEKQLGPSLAKLLGLPTNLLRSQLSSNLSRTIGTTLAITSGLALYASTQIWGHTMLQHYVPGDWLPDALVAFHPVGLSDEEVSSVSAVEGITASDTLPLAVEQAKFAWPDNEVPNNLRRDNAVIIGFDAARAIGRDTPFLDFEFVQGKPHQVAQLLANERCCIIGEDFATLTRLEVGDLLPFSPPNVQEAIVQYRIVGVVSLPGWQWMTKFSGVRRHFVRTSALVFADAAQVRKDFKLRRNEFFWINLTDKTPLADVEASLQVIAEKSADRSFTAPGYGEVKAHRPFARITTTENIKKAITMVAREVIWSMSYLPLVTLAITSLAVANAVVASVRARSWQIGIMRSIGITRAQIVCLILSEAILISFTACIVSLSFGLLAGWCNVGMSRYSGMFYSPPTVAIPWGAISASFLFTLIFCIVCALRPAIKASRCEPLTLLEDGRSAV